MDGNLLISRLSPDLMDLFFIIGKYTDNTDGVKAHTYADMVANIFENPHVERPQGERIIGEITQQYAQFSVYFSSASFYYMVCPCRF